jgi:hypothetical protein
MTPKEGDWIWVRTQVRRVELDVTTGRPVFDTYPSQTFFGPPLCPDWRFCEDMSSPVPAQDAGLVKAKDVL